MAVIQGPNAGTPAWQLAGYPSEAAYNAAMEGRPPRDQGYAAGPTAPGVDTHQYNSAAPVQQGVAPSNPTPEQLAEIQAHPQSRSNPFGALTNPDGSIYHEPTAAPPPPPGQTDPNAPAPAGGPPGSPGLFSDPGYYENWIKDHIGQTDNPSNVENTFASGATSGATTPVGPGSYADWYTQHQGDLSGPGARESGAGALTSAAYGVGSGDTGFSYSAPTIDAGNKAFAQGESALSGPGVEEQLYAAGGADPLKDPGYMARYLAAFGLDPSKLSDTETLYNQGVGHLDPAYDYAEQRAIKTAQTASSARGGFNNGLTAQQESDITGNIRGQQAQEWVNLAPQADAAKLNRLTLAGNQAVAGDTDTQNRIKALFGVAGDTQGQTNARLSTLGNLAATSDAGTKAQGDLSLQAEHDRVQAEDAANQTRLKALGLVNDVNAGSDAEREARFNDSSSAANTANTNELATDAENRARAAALYNEAGAADTAQQTRLGEGASLAKDEQATAQDRVNTMINGIAGQNQREANLLQSALGDMSSVDKLDDEWFNAEAQKLGVDVQQLKDLASAAGKAIDVGVSVGKAASGTPGK